VNREEILAVYHLGPDAVVELVSALLKEINDLKERVNNLEQQNAKNSRNSNNPPSADGFRKIKKSGKKKKGRKTGGQKGHEGHTLKMSESPDEVIVIPITSCKRCGHSLKNVAKNHDRRQQFDIPPLKLSVTEYRIEKVACPQCGKVSAGEFPKHIRKSTQYGSRFRSLLVYLSQYQLLPYRRIREYVNDVFGHRVSEGTLYNTIKECYNNLEETEAKIKSRIIESYAAGFDESGARCEGKLHWLHTAGTDKHTFFGFHQKRGQEAMDEFGILPNFQGYAMHDCFWPYFNYFSCSHLLCNSHLIRELTFQHEELGQKWAGDMIDLILEIKEKTDIAKERGKSSALPKRMQLDFERRFDRKVRTGLRKNPYFRQMPGRKGRSKQTDTYNLLVRLKCFKDLYLEFMYDFRVPFDNNQSERDFRMLKVHQKISGCFRSFAGAQFFCRIRGYISTARKNGVNILDAIAASFSGNPFVPAAEG